MVRRVPWVSWGPKRVPNDCIVVSFRSKHLATKALTFLSCVTPSSHLIHIQPLGFFYAPGLPALQPMVASGWAKTTQHPSSFQTQGPNSHAPLALYNQFTPLCGLDALD